jgi:hypothetical protein
MSMYLSTPDLRPTGYEPAEFIDAIPEPADAGGQWREPPQVGDEPTSSPSAPSSRRDAP